MSEINYQASMQEMLKTGILNNGPEWCIHVRKMLDELVRELDLPDKSLYLSDNYGRVETDKVISYSVCIWEPDYPPLEEMKQGPNKIVMTLRPMKDDLEMVIREIQEGDLHGSLPDDAIVQKRTKTDIKDKRVRVKIKQSSPNLTDYIKKHTLYCIEDYVSKSDRFGCCDRFEECSEQKKCVHPNKLYSKACSYRVNLEQGKVFYEK